MAARKIPRTENITLNHKCSRKMVQWRWPRSDTIQAIHIPEMHFSPIYEPHFCSKTIKINNEKEKFHMCSPAHFAVAEPVLTPFSKAKTPYSIYNSRYFAIFDRLKNKFPTKLRLASSTIQQSLGV